MPNKTHEDGPMWMLAELTYRCVLQCAYCSNPLNYRDDEYTGELTGDEWANVLEQARDMGCVQLGLSGGEPMLHRDIYQVVHEAAQLGFYTSLITAGSPLNEEKVRRLKDEGLDHVQVSIDGASAEINNAIVNKDSYEEKLEACRLVRRMGFPLTLNVVLHRFNLHQVGDLIDLADELGSDRIELANTQYHGWALANRKHLMPKKEQFDRATEIVKQKREEYEEMDIVWVVPDYYAEYPKPCMGGWARQYMNVTPGGMAVPCHSAADIEELDFPNVRERSLEWIWHESPAFNAFRGTDWMNEPCRSCPRKDVDFGGCRCQAYMLTGDARNADPVCHLSPDHDLIEDAIAEAEETESEIEDVHFRNPQSIGEVLPTTMAHRAS